MTLLCNWVDLTEKYVANLAESITKADSWFGHGVRSVSNVANNTNKNLPKLFFILLLLVYRPHWEPCDAIVNTTYKKKKKGTWIKSNITSVGPGVELAGAGSHGPQKFKKKNPKIIEILIVFFYICAKPPNQKKRKLYNGLHGKISWAGQLASCSSSIANGC